MEKIVLYTDGGARGNPGPAAAGAVVLDEEGTVLAEVSDYLGETTNNVAEYEALIRVLKAAHKLFGTKLLEMQVEVRMDSELIVRQMTGIYKVRDAVMKELFAKVQEEIRTYAPNVTFTHVRREKNKLADALVNKAIDLGAPHTKR